MQGITQTIFNFTLILLVFHVDEIDHHQAAQVTQTQLPRDFFRRFQIGIQRSLLNIRPFRRLRGVDVNGHQRFGMINHDRAARGQRYLTRKGAFNLMLNLETGKQRHRVGV